MERRTKVAAVVGAGVLATAGLVAGSSIAPISATSSTSTETTKPATGCNDWAGTFTAGECYASGTIRYVALTNLQGAAQFCKWRAANPGEWSRLKSYALTGDRATSISTWLGASILNEIEAYFATGAPVFTIAPNEAPNTCGRGKLVAPPTITGITPGSGTVTVTVAPG